MQLLGWADVIFPANGALPDSAAAVVARRAGLVVLRHERPRRTGESQRNALHARVHDLEWFDHWFKGTPLE